MSPATARLPRVSSAGRAIHRIPRRVVLAFVAAVVLAAFVLWLLLASPWFRLREVEYRGDAGPAQRRAVAQAAAPPLGQPLVQVDTDAIADRIIELGTVAQVDVSRTFPHGLTITVDPRRPVVAVPGDAGRYAVVDRDGLPFSVVAAVPRGVPLATVRRPGDASDLVTLAALVQALSPDQRTKMSKLQVDVHGVASFDVDGVSVRWGTDERSDLKAKVVTVLLGRSGVRAIDVTVPEQPMTRS